MIICVDMDAFFASVEKASKPHLKDKPVAVIGAKERTVVTTACYIARKYGVKTGMSKYEAEKMCPFINLVEGNNRKYTYISSQIMDFFKTLTDKVEVYSVDEAFLQIPDEEVADVIVDIKNYVKKCFGITCSVGAGKSKLVAKMASGINKPNGSLVVSDDETVDFLDSFKLEDIWGIGKKLSERFYNMGVFNTADMRKLGRDKLCKVFGKNGYYYYMMACGDDREGIRVEDEAVKSIGHSMTFPEDVRDIRMFNAYLLQLCEMVSGRARRHSVSGRTITVSIRFPDMTTLSKRHTVNYLTCATHHIYDVSRYITTMFPENFLENGIRLIGVTLSNLLHDTQELCSVFDEKRDMENVYKAMDAINEKYGSFTVSFASVLNCRRKGARTISPAWKPEGVRKINVL